MATWVRTASRKELAAVWREAYGRAPNAGVSRQLLEHAAAWSLQARQHGGLTPAVRAKLKRLEKAGARPSPVQSKPLVPSGTRLVREWNGQTHLVDATPDGFIYEGMTYRSLSAVARAITGARWSGPRFFGLNQKSDC